MNRHWALKLGDICDIVSGATPKTGVEAYWGGDIRWATPADLSDLDGAYLDETPRKITAAGLASCSAQVLPANSVMLSSRAPIGHVAINSVPMATNQGFKSLVPKEGLADAKFLYHWLNYHKPQIQALGNGATFKEVSKATVSEIGIDLPPFEDQRRIAGILDKADALRQKRKHAIALLDSLTQSIFFEMFGDLVENPKGYHRGPISRWVADFESGKNLAPATDDDVPGRFRVLKVSAVTSGEFDARESKPLPDGYLPPLAHMVRSGDLLFSRANTAELVGATALVGETPSNIALPDKLWRFAWNEQNAPNPLFIDNLFSTPGFRAAISKRATGTSGSMKNISKGKVLSLVIGQPDRPQQDNFGNRALTVRRTAARAKKDLDCAEFLFASLRHRAFSGQL